MFVFFQLPLDTVNKIDDEVVLNAISPEKDVDGYDYETSGLQVLLYDFIEFLGLYQLLVDCNNGKPTLELQIWCPDHEPAGVLQSWISQAGKVRAKLKWPGKMPKMLQSEEIWAFLFLWDFV